MPRQVIDVAALRARDPAVQRERQTFLIYGDTRSGKTRLLGTYPRVAIITNKVENGHVTILTMAADAFYEPNRVPHVELIDDHNALWEAFKSIKAMRDADPDRFWTLGIELTFYADGYKGMLEAAQIKKQGYIDKFKLYGDLEFHLRYLMTLVHNDWPGDVVWTALAKSPEDKKPGGVLIGGQTDKKAPARCDNLWFLEQDSAAGIWKVHTKAYGPYPAGGRDEGRVPSPLPEASYRAFEKAYYGKHRVER